MKFVSSAAVVVEENVMSANEVFYKHEISIAESSESLFLLVHVYEG